jgi:hypothetical protein
MLKWVYVEWNEWSQRNRYRKQPEDGPKLRAKQRRNK